MKKIIITFLMLLSFFFVKRNVNAQCVSDFLPMVGYINLGLGSGYGYIDGDSMNSEFEESNTPFFFHFGLGYSTSVIMLELFIDSYDQTGKIDSGGTVVSVDYNITTMGFSAAFVPSTTGPFFKLGFGECFFTAEGAEGKYAEITNIDNDNIEWKSYSGTSLIFETGYMSRHEGFIQFSINFQYAYQTYHGDVDEIVPDNTSYFAAYVSIAVGSLGSIE